MSGNLSEWCEDLYGDYRSYDTDNPKVLLRALTACFVVAAGAAMLRTAVCRIVTSIVRATVTTITASASSAFHS